MMVDFNKLGKVTQQWDTVVALVNSMVYHRVLIIVKDSQDVDNLSIKLWGQIKDKWPIMQRNDRLITTRIGPSTHWIRFVPHDRLKFVARGLQSDLLWVKYHSPKTDPTELNYVKLGLRLGYNPLLLQMDEADY